MTFYRNYFEFELEQELRLMDAVRGWTWYGASPLSLESAFCIIALESIIEEKSA